MPGCFWRVLISQLLGIRAFRWRSRRRNAFNLLLREVMCILFITSFTHFIPIPSYIHFLLIPFLYILFNTFCIHSRPIFLILSQYLFFIHSLAIPVLCILSNNFFFRRWETPASPENLPPPSLLTSPRPREVPRQSRAAISTTIGWRRPSPRRLLCLSYSRRSQEGTLTIIYFTSKKNNGRVVRRQGKGGFMNDECANQLTE